MLPHAVHLVYITVMDAAPRTDDRTIATRPQLTANFGARVAFSIASTRLSLLYMRAVTTLLLLQLSCLHDPSRSPLGLHRGNGRCNAY